MPCPFFEPRAVVRHPHRAGGRLPLLDEYEGACLAAPQPFEPPEELRLRCCNHGYSRGACVRFPIAESRSCTRFDVRGATADALDLLCVEEQDHAPVRWHSLRYCIWTKSLEPPLDDSCIRAQALAFCQSYLRRFS